MINKKNFYLLDCTLRDGGYVNNWEFDFSCARRIIRGLYSSGVDIIECGFMGKTPNTGKTTVFNSLKEMQSIIENKKSDCIYMVMMNTIDQDEFDIPPYDEKSIDGIRLAFFKKEAIKAVEYAKELKEKGYLVSLQAMATYMYSEYELNRLIEHVNNIQPFSFALVDSFGTLYNDDVEKIYNTIDKNLSDDIVFGFHAHNNMQMAFSNAIHFIELGRKRKISVDASIYGMGRGAGNVATELIMEYMNRKYSTEYDVSKIIRVYEKELLPVYNRLHWGYSAQYFITAKADVNPAYGWYLNRKKIFDLETISNIINAIPKDDRYTLKTDVIDEILLKNNIFDGGGNCV